jgi:hypothetical protein
MNSLETNILYKQQRKIEAQRQKVEETTRKYYE